MPRLPSMSSWVFSCLALAIVAPPGPRTIRHEKKKEPKLNRICRKLAINFNFESDSPALIEVNQSKATAQRKPLGPGLFLATMHFGSCSPLSLFGAMHFTFTSACNLPQQVLSSKNLFNFQVKARPLLAKTKQQTSCKEQEAKTRLIYLSQERLFPGTAVAAALGAAAFETTSSISFSTTMLFFFNLLLFAF